MKTIWVRAELFNEFYNMQVEKCKYIYYKVLLICSVMNLPVFYQVCETLFDWDFDVFVFDGTTLFSLL